MLSDKISSPKSKKRKVVASDDEGARILAVVPNVGPHSRAGPPPSSSPAPMASSPAPPEQDDDDDVPIKKSKAKATTIAKPKAAKKSAPSSSSTASTTKPKAKTKGKTKAILSDEDDADDIIPPLEKAPVTSDEDGAAEPDSEGEEELEEEEANEKYALASRNLCVCMLIIIQRRDCALESG